MKPLLPPPQLAERQYRCLLGLLADGVTLEETRQFMWYDQKLEVYYPPNPYTEGPPDVDPEVLINRSTVTQEPPQPVDGHAEKRLSRAEKARMKRLK